MKLYLLYFTLLSILLSTFKNKFKKVNQKYRGVSDIISDDKEVEVSLGESAYE